MKPEIKVATYPNGQKQRETLYVNGQRHGLETWWYENGQKMSEILYANGQRHGLAIWLYPNGQKWHETPYTNGQKHGLITSWHFNGSLSWIRKWHQDQLVWDISFTSQEQIFENAELELFFHEPPYLI